MIRCSECRAPQPEQDAEEVYYELHFENCSKHDTDVCIACQEMTDKGVENEPEDEIDAACDDFDIPADYSRSRYEAH